MQLFFLTGFISLLLFVYCSPPPSGKYNTTRDVADAVRSEGTATLSFCTGKECCSEHKSCTRMCNQILYNSDDDDEAIRKKCHSLPKEIVVRLEELTRILKSPSEDDMNYIDLSEEFSLLLALDYRIWVELIRSYEVDEARELLIWMAKNGDVAKELLELKEEARNEIIFEILASAGDRNQSGHGPVESGLTHKISFDQSFFQLLISHSNYDILQITHNMIRKDLCAYGASSETEICLLRIYCKEKSNANNQYVHSEDLRNEIARNIQDEDLFNYVEREVLGAGFGLPFTEPIMNNQVCFITCNDDHKGCGE